MRKNATFQERHSVKFYALLTKSYSLAEVVCLIMHCSFAPNQERTTLCCLYILLSSIPSFAVLPVKIMYVFIHGVVDCFNIFPTIAIHILCIDHRHWFRWAAA